jgi:RNA polymerase sigma factor (sigma-70 family)
MRTDLRHPDMNRQMTAVEHDWILWQKASGGDRVAFGELFERHANAIYAFCFRRTGRWPTAEDLVSIVFLEAWRHRDARIEDGKVLPWLYGVATNVIRNQQRAERRYSAALSRIPASTGEEDFAGAVEAAIDSERAMQVILTCLRKLSKPDQDVFVLCAWCDLSYEDAALALAIPLGTVRSRLSRARRQLRELGVGAGHLPTRPALEGGCE